MSLERWFLSSNAKDIGTLYLIFALFSGLLGTVFSVLIRLELSGPGVQYIADNHLYNSIITAHAILMIFFMVMPAMIGGFGNFLLPLVVGGPDMAFPRLNNISFWLLPPSLILFIFAGTIENGAGAGTVLTIFHPLSGIQCHSGPGVDLAIFALHLSGISSLLCAVNLIYTILSCNRLHKLALFGWAILVTAVLLLLSLPVLANAINVVILDRNPLVVFFEVQEGSSILYQHFILFLVHPEVAFTIYIVIAINSLIIKLFPQSKNFIWFCLLIIVILYHLTFFLDIAYADVGPLTDTQARVFLGHFKSSLAECISQSPPSSNIRFTDVMAKTHHFYSNGDYVLRTLLDHKCGLPRLPLGSTAVTLNALGQPTNSTVLENLFA